MLVRWSLQGSRTNLIGILDQKTKEAPAENNRCTLVADMPGRGHYTTIQAAESAASDGDTIVIIPNSDRRGYREVVTVTTPNLTITGRPTTKASTKSSKMRTRTLKTMVMPAKNNESRRKKHKQDRGLTGDAEDLFPFDALDERGFPSLLLLEQPKYPDVFLDGCDDRGSCDNTVLAISAPGVTIDHLSIRHGAIEFAAGSDGGKLVESCLLGDTSDVVSTFGSPFPYSITISNNYFQGGRHLNVELDGNFHEISYNLVTPCEHGFYINGDDGHIASNKMFGCTVDTIEYFGDRGTIADNEIYHSGDGITYSGDDCITTNNTLIGVGGRGIRHYGDNPTITHHNTVEYIQQWGIDVNCRIPCSGGAVAHNKVIGGADGYDGIGIGHANKEFKIEYNTISYSSKIGLDFSSGTDSTIRFNDIACGGTSTSASNNQHGMEIRGDNNAH